MNNNREGFGAQGRLQNIFTTHCRAGNGICSAVYDAYGEAISQGIKG